MTEVTPISSFRTIDLPLGQKHQGKVRDWWLLGDGRRVIVTTDRQSAFDVVLGAIPYKGQVLNRMAAWWFEKTEDIVANHVLAVPDANVMIVRDAEPWPVEMVIRGYITGVTDTSLWTHYEKGERRMYGLELPDGLRKNQRLPEPLITPTSKAASGGHDERLSREQILDEGRVPRDVYEEMERVTRALFQRGTEVAAAQGIILVDTKYEFGQLDGELVLIDEIHTPDSSRFWLAETYAERFAAGEEPETFDKELLRRWYAEKGYTGEGEPPPIPSELKAEMSSVYVDIYERVTGQAFVPELEDPVDRICDALEAEGILEPS